MATETKHKDYGNDVLRRAYEAHDANGIQKYLDAHKKESRYADLYEEIQQHPEKAYDAVGRYLEGFGDKREQEYPIREKKEGNTERFILERKKNENIDDYCRRLVAYCSNQIEMIAIYEEERKKDRFRQSQSASRRVLEGDEQAVHDLLKIIKQFQDEIDKYQLRFPNFSVRNGIKRKKEHLDSLL